MATPKRSTTARGLGGKHQKQRERLLRSLTDGTPCYWCNRPMSRDPEHNWDYAALEADHTKSRHTHGTHGLADRLLHRACNRQRSTGDWDTQRPAATGTPVEDWSRTNINTERARFQHVNVTFA